MKKPFAPGVGGVLSADIAVPDHARELGFYSAVLTTGENPLWRDDLTNSLGIPIIGLGARTPEYESLPLQWMPHFQVANINSSIEAAIELGGEALMRSEADDSGQSQWAVMTDPAGAAFGLILVVDDAAYAESTQWKSGNIAWLTLAVPEVSSSRDFYQKVIGWEAKQLAGDPSNDNSSSYEMLRDKTNSAAEICHNSGAYKDVPAVWLMSLPVGDLKESLRQVNEGGGKVIHESIDAEYAIIRDPVGVHLALQSQKD